MELRGPYLQPLTGRPSGKGLLFPRFQARDDVSCLHNHGTHNGRLNKAGAGGACFMLKKQV